MVYWGTSIGISPTSTTMPTSTNSYAFWANEVTVPLAAHEATNLIGHILAHPTLEPWEKLELIGMAVRAVKH